MILGDCCAGGHVHRLVLLFVAQECAAPELPTEMPSAARLNAGKLSLSDNFPALSRAADGISVGSSGAAHSCATNRRTNRWTCPPAQQSPRIIRSRSPAASRLSLAQPVESVLASLAR